MQAIELADVMRRHAAGGERYHEFLRVPALSMGMYVLPAAAVDTQSPHGEDEIYYVVRGRGQFTVEDETCAVQAGSILYVKAHDAHRFHDITESLELLVFFAPAEYG